MRVPGCARARWASSAGREPGERVARQPLDGPLVHADGADGAVEADGGLVPVEDRPLEPAIAALGAHLRQPRQERLAVAAASLVLPHVQVLEVDAAATGPGGVV